MADKAAPVIKKADGQDSEPGGNPNSLCGMVVFASDVDRLSRFYQAILPFDVVESQPTYHVLRSDDAELVIHGISKKAAQSINLQEPPQARSNTALKPMFRVASLRALRPLVTSNGGTLKPLRSAWSIRGDRVLDGTDCEGNVLQFRE